MRSWDHPRVCGEKSGKSRPGKAGGGSPPRMRGKGVGAAHFAGYHGITPAYAGKSLRQFPVRRFLWDHPRVCGEKRLRLVHYRSLEGSPPRMRGKGFRDQNIDNPAGITPAYAGKSGLVSHVPTFHWDHPRVCGEKSVRAFKNQANLGSPPRMRGKAGSKHRYGMAAEDHPRVCGEKFNTHVVETPGQGSPPRMRGKDSWNALQWSSQGITPAYAGKSTSWPQRAAISKDHPRVCGEKKF